MAALSRARTILTQRTGTFWTSSVPRANYRYPSSLYSVRSYATESSKSTTAYKAPATNVNPAYDAALAYLESYKQTHVAEANKLEAELQAKKSQATKEQTEALMDKIYHHRVEAEVHSVETLWNFEHNPAKVDLTVPVYHYLAQRAFTQNYLPMLQQRVEQMYVVPDVLPPSQVQPTCKVLVQYPQQDPFTVGVVLEPRQVCDTPQITVTPFHAETRLYTLVMVDPDHPNQETQSYEQYCHWLKTNVPLSVTQTLVGEQGETVLDYVPPHPPQGTKRHRYTFLLLLQPNQGQDRLDLTPEQLNPERLFQTREFCQTNGLTLQGITFFRAEYDESVKQVYEQILQKPMPRFGHQPYVDPRVGPDGKMLNRYRYQ
ncbi:mitochondrial 54S ribosomal protein YmL35 [Dispira parvispora]|uniref:Mitochondrial 54S ribosomal protein YmL35 n=1 Tax=Dispira parvispora TaxID=1520584 RepID=A0A9W8AQL3_9FUNG|nr:mitochondrial 54S ribosomal protein YmL35 [Dispira parvispora]